MWKYRHTDELYHGDTWSYGNSDELYHYGILGMKWGVRRATYKLRSANSLKKSKERVEKDITKLEVKANKKKKKAAKAQMKAAKRMGNGDFDGSSEYFKKSAKANRIAQKREKTAIHNKKLIKLYEKRIKELEELEAQDVESTVKKKKRAK